MQKNKKLLIVGLGLMGGSYAEKLSSKGYKVYAIDNDPKAIQIGLKRKIILNKESDTEDSLIKSADYIVVALKPSLVVNWINEHQDLFKDNVFITDMMGVKSNFISKIQKTLTKGEFISMHPMTGKELSGVLYSSSNIFNSFNMLIVKTSKNTKQGINFAISLSKALDAKKVSILSSTKHDKVVGYVSHLAHVLSVCYMNSYDDEAIFDYAGTAFKDITRIANINEDIWSELFLYNKKQIIPLIEKYQDNLEKIKRAIRDVDEDKLKEILKESRRRREKYNLR